MPASGLSPLFPPLARPGIFAPSPIFADFKERTFMKKTFLAAGVAVLAMGTVAYAAPGMMKAEGPVTMAEAKAKSGEMFARMDVNGDGKIDSADRKARQDERFAKMDTDGNGSISRAEFDAMHGMHGMRGQGGAHEMGGAHMMGGDHAMGGRQGKRGGHGGMGMMGMMADTNKDGVITRAEFDAGVTSHFAQMDTNGDGTVTVEERKVAREKMRETRMEKREARQPN